MWYHVANVNRVPMPQKETNHCRKMAFPDHEKVASIRLPVFLFYRSPIGAHDR